MKPRSLLAAAVLLAALSGVVWWSKKHPDSGTASSTTGTSVKLLDAPSDQLKEITLKKKGGTQISLARENGKWRITAPESLPADQDSVSSLASTLAPLSADSVVEEKPSETSKYGLNAPSLVLTVARTNGKNDTLELGDEAPAGSLVYAQRAGDPKVYALSSSTKSSLDKSVNDLRDKRLLTFDSGKLTSLEVEAAAKPKTPNAGAKTEPKKTGPITFAKNNQGDWQITKPGPYRADSFQVEELIRKLQDARMDLSSSADDQKKAAGLYASGQPVAIAKATDSSGTQSLDIRKNKNDYYGKSSAVAGIYKVSSDLGTALDKTLDDFRSHKLYDFGFNDPTKLEFHNGTSTAAYQKSGQDWKQNGKTMDAASIQSVIDQLRDLSSSGFPADGFANPQLDITVVSNDGKRTEKISFAKTGDKYVARREGEPSLYEVAGKNVDDIVKAFGQIKPAAPAKK